MVLSETRGLWLSWIVREGIGWSRRLACLSTGLTFPMDTSPESEQRAPARGGIARVLGEAKKKQTLYEGLYSCGLPVATETSHPAGTGPDN